MYMLVTLVDTIQIQPPDFSKPGSRAVEDFINTKYADRVIHKVGLCVCFHSIVRASEGLIGHGTGTVNVIVEFRLLVFRPFRGEILAATIASSSLEHGVRLSMDFFDDIAVPPETLFEGSVWENDDEGTGESVWIYKWKNEETGEQNDLFFDQAEKCLVRVEEEQWTDMPPKMKALDVEELEEDGSRKTPYLIRGSMMHSGLGPRIWWEGE